MYGDNDKDDNDNDNDKDDNDNDNDKDDKSSDWLESWKLTTKITEQCVTSVQS